VADYTNVVTASIFPEFGRDTPIEKITTERIEAWRERLLDEGDLSRRTIQKMLVLLHGVMKRAKRRKSIASNPAEDVERVTVKRSGDFNVLSPVEVEAVARAAANQQDAAIFKVAAFTGLRLGELRALRWRDVDFAKQTVHVRGSYTRHLQGLPKSGKVRSVPLIDQASVALDGLSSREHFTGPGDLVFCTETGDHLPDKPIRTALYDALDAAGLGAKRNGDDPIVFHDLRHTFGTLAVEAWPLHDVQAYMGHADIQTTMIYVHHQPKTAAADAHKDRRGGVRTAGSVSESARRDRRTGQALGGDVNVDPILEQFDLRDVLLCDCGDQQPVGVPHVEDVVLVKEGTLAAGPRAPVRHIE
jgi:integrase